MKRTIIAIFLMLMMVMSVSALVQYKGRPSTPYPILGKVTVNEEIVGGVKVKITNLNTGYTEEKVTTSRGYYLTEGMNFQTTRSARPPVMYGDTIRVEVLGDCASGEECTKEFEVFSDGYEIQGRVDFNFKKTSFPYITPTLAAIIGGLIVLAATILGKKYSWGNRFIGLVKYWSLKDPKRALKMINTSLKREQEGYYDKKKK